MHAGPPSASPVAQEYVAPIQYWFPGAQKAGFFKSEQVPHQTRCQS
jgi:hypothetical protein